MIRILIVDDHQGFRDGLRTLLENEPDIEVAGEAADGPEAVEKALSLRPEVILMDIGLPGMNGLEAARQIRQRRINSRVIMLTSHGAEEYREAAAAVGASDYIVKQFACDLLATAIRRVMTDVLESRLMSHLES